MNRNKFQNQSKASFANGLSIALLVGALATTAMAQSIRASVDGTMVNFPDVQPTMMSGRVMVPVRGVFEHMNADVEWDGSQRIVTAFRSTDTIWLKLNSKTASINGNQVPLETPAVMHNGRTMVPLRFISEALGASVDWISESRTVEIKTGGPTMNTNNPMRIERGTVLPFQLKTKLTSNNSKVGDKFTANIDTSGLVNYQGIPEGTVLEGRVDAVSAKTGDTPGVLGLAFDRLRFKNGTSMPISGALIGLDSDSISNENGRLVAKPKAVNDNLKYVGYGAGAGTLVAILTKGNLLTSTLIGAALGLILGEIQKNPTQARDVTLDTDSKFGVRITNDLYIGSSISVPK